MPGVRRFELSRKEGCRVSEQAYTLAMYRVKAGREDAFISAWDELAGTFKSLPNPPLWGTLIRHRADRMLFYSFGPWRSAGDVAAMRESAEAGAAFARLRELCEELTPGDYELVRQVGGRRRRPRLTTACTRPRISMDVIREVGWLRVRVRGG